MNEFYARTGGYRPEDIARVMGDNPQGVQFGTLESHSENKPAK